MSRTQKIIELLTAPKKDLTRVALSFMDIDTLHYIASLREDNPDGEVKAEELPEPYRTDVLNSYQKAKDEIPTKQRTKGSAITRDKPSTEQTNISRIHSAGNIPRY